MKTGRALLSTLVNTDDPRAVFKEVKHIISLIYPGSRFILFNEVFNGVFEDVIKLFRGSYPGYRKCNTEYHDLKHTTDILLCFARLIHGAHLKKLTFSEEAVMMGLISALMHDTGYIQVADDVNGSGAKYTLTHVERSIGFVKTYFSQKGCPVDYNEKCDLIIQCTSLTSKIDEIPFGSKETGMIAKMLGTADIVGQIADRAYLEKLLFLYHEFDEGIAGGYKDELDLLKKTLSFYEFVEKRLHADLGNMSRYFRYHFRERWDIDQDMYKIAIEKNIKYLNLILSDREKNYKSYLKRGKVRNKLR